MSNYVIWLQFTRFHKPPSQQFHDLFPKPSSNVQAAVYTVYSNTPTDPSGVVQVQNYDTELVTYIQTVSRWIRLRGSFWRTTEGAEICRGSEPEPYHTDRRLAVAGQGKLCFWLLRGTI